MKLIQSKVIEKLQRLLLTDTEIMPIFLITYSLLVKGHFYFITQTLYLSHEHSCDYYFAYKFETSTTLAKL